MNSKTQLAIVALLVGFAVFLVLSKPIWWKDAPSADREEIERLQTRVSTLENERDEMKRSIERALNDYQRLARMRISSQGEIPAGASGSVEESRSDPNEPAGVTGRLQSRPTATGLTLESALAALLDQTVSYDDREKLWKRIRDAGLTDDVIKELEKRVAAKPKDPQAQTDLAKAYLKKLQEVPAGPEQGIWGKKADESFDKALEIDPEHWEARFTKAVSLSFWPAALGKGSEAIKNFETLVNQQEHQTAREGFEHTYYFLGNMYQQMGQRDQAIATWQRGLKLFPDNAALQHQLSSAGR